MLTGLRLPFSGLWLTFARLTGLFTRLLRLAVRILWLTFTRLRLSFTMLSLRSLSLSGLTGLARLRLCSLGRSDFRSFGSVYRFLVQKLRGQFEGLANRLVGDLFLTGQLNGSLTSQLLRFSKLLDGFVQFLGRILLLWSQISQLRFLWFTWLRLTRLRFAGFRFSWLARFLLARFLTGVGWLRFAGLAFGSARLGGFAFAWFLAFVGHWLCEFVENLSRLGDLIG